MPANGRSSGVRRHVLVLMRPGWRRIAASAWNIENSRQPGAAMEPLHAEVQRQRQTLLRRVSAVLDAPMTILSFVWVGLMIVEFTGELSPPLEALNYVIWTLFVLHFAVEFWIAPRKLVYLQKNWLTALSL